MRFWLLLLALLGGGEAYAAVYNAPMPTVCYPNGQNCQQAAPIANPDGSFVGTGGSSSTGTVGNTAPTAATQVGGQDTSGNLQVLPIGPQPSAKSVSVVPANDLTTPVPTTPGGVAAGTTSNSYSQGATAVPFNFDAKGNLKATIVFGNAGIETSPWSFGALNADGNGVFSSLNVPNVRAFGLYFNGSTMDRTRGNTAGAFTIASPVLGTDTVNILTASTGTNTAVTDSLVACSAACSAYGGQVNNTSASMVWVFLFNLTAKPADGALTGTSRPVKKYQLAANSTLSFELQHGGIPLRFSTGLVVECSTSAAGAFSAAASANCDFSVEKQ